MPFPPANSKWPPPELAVPHRDIARWAAWFAGDPDLLQQVYGGGFHPTEQSWSQQSWTARGGLVGAVQRWFWGQPTTPGQARGKLHIPLAAEIAQVSADLLFGQPPQITVDDQATQERIDELMGETVHTQLHEAAEACAALGAVYLRVVWDRDVDPTAPILSAVDADAAFPVYSYGRLQEVTFLRQFSETGGVMRHLELHEKGLVRHALYLGDVNNLGRQIPLAEHPSTANLAGSITVDGNGIATGLDRLDVVAIPNARTRTWRHLPQAKDLGRADVSGVETELDALDDVWSSWMRDVRHGRSRIHVPQHMLESRGPGKGATIDLDRELYVGLEVLASDGKMDLTATQFKIRHEEHRSTALSLVKEIVSGAGYSPQTFGLEEASAITATESWAKQTRTQHTRSAKVRRWRTGLADLTMLMLAVDQAQFKGKGDPTVRPDVAFADTVSESQLARAQTALALFNADAASTDTRVRLQHPDWDDEQVTEEVRRITSERGSAPSPLDNMFERDRLTLNRPEDQPDPDQDLLGEAA